MFFLVIVQFYFILFRFVSLNFPNAPTVLFDNMSTRVPTEGASAAARESLPEVTEVRLVGLGLAGRRPLLLARTKDKELILYQEWNNTIVTVELQGSMLYTGS